MRCPICGTELNGCLCPTCGYDPSRDREQYPTIMNDGQSPESVWVIRNKWFEKLYRQQAQQSAQAPAQQAVQTYGQAPAQQPRQPYAQSPAQQPGQAYFQAPAQPGEAEEKPPKKKKALWLIPVAAALLALGLFIGLGSWRSGGADTRLVDTESLRTAQSAGKETQTAAVSYPATKEITTSGSYGQKLGDGKTYFYFSVTFSNGDTTRYVIHTDADTVGDALLSLNLVAGDKNQYGFHVKTVCGETLDWDQDSMYWSFFEGDEYALRSVDFTSIAEGQTYRFVATKG